jgi:hypothetical protein
MYTYTFHITDPYGVPLPGLVSPAVQFLKYVSRTGDAIAILPTIVDLGNGSYKFSINANDPAAVIGAVFLIQTSNTPSYFAGTISAPSNPFEAFALVDEASGAIWAGADPVFGEYADFAGVARTAPIITALGSGLYTFTPPVANMATGDVWRIDCPVGAYPPVFYGYSGPYVTAAVFTAAGTPHLITPTFTEPTARPLSRKDMMDSGEV